MSERLLQRCEGRTRAGTRCTRSATGMGRRCDLHQVQIGAPKPKYKKPVKPEFYTRTHSKNIGRMFDETQIKTKAVYLRFGDADLELEWNHGMQAFSIRTMHKGLRDGLTVIPDSSNRIFIKVGER